MLVQLHKHLQFQEYPHPLQERILEGRLGLEKAKVLRCNSTVILKL